MTLIEAILLAFLIASAIATVVTKRLLASVIIFASYSAVMSVVWLLLAAPDMALTEAAVGVGITGVLFFVVLKRIQSIKQEDNEKEEGGNENGE